MKREITELLLKTKAVTLRPTNPFTWVSGIFAPIYTDNRILMSCPEERKIVVKSMIETIRKECPDFDYVAGVATSGIPWAAWIASYFDRPMVYARGNRKGHGKENVVEGRLEKGKKAILIEDLISTGGSSETAVDALREAGAAVTNCFAIFTYGLKKADETFRRINCTLTALTDFTTLLQTASETGYISEEEKKSCEEWADDPEGWGK
ncbi:MAG: orotate phosphoribosyltransferase [Candidatus Aenigmatarchaeota archaeon]|nr:MAG: orotate phosphoribosyltransferase [Candidatus Aenigmarchaeota archaeon]